MILKAMLYKVLKRRWSSLLVDPDGFPEHPTMEKCWAWKGSFRDPHTSTKANQPRASLLGELINPRHLLYLLHHNILTEHPPILKPMCGNPACINPKHQREAGIILSRDLTTMNSMANADWEDLLRSIDFPRNLSPEEIAAQAGVPIEAARKWSTLTMEEPDVRTIEDDS